jgi:hypothetical protein
VQDMPAISGNTETHTGVWRGNLKERNHLESLGVDVIITSLYILKEETEVRRLDSSDSGL